MKETEIKHGQSDQKYVQLQSYVDAITPQELDIYDYNMRILEYAKQP